MLILLRCLASDENLHSLFSKAIHTSQRCIMLILLRCLLFCVMLHLLRGASIFSAGPWFHMTCELSELSELRGDVAR